ncbi:hypothetical protein CF15_07315 [Pyrodictium occultum]|uniref:Uncharacterized protein n=1 Tax=Pyrodictium occultum TaxID=2309 RepID=A0A0V8RWX4_PYROC|nr:hypothetical protein [Pyrodictium occultum]KSW12520.1 hypothetical protein CF15_07315 [Pyrodictium occultum]
MLLLPLALAAGALLGLALERLGIYSRVSRHVGRLIEALVYLLVFLVGLEAGSALRGGSRSPVLVVLEALAYAAASSLASLASAVALARLTRSRRRAS